MRVLFLDPYHGGSHRAFSAGWRDHSAHTLEILDLPAHHWKWRMRHAAWTLARRAGDLEPGEGERMPSGNPPLPEADIARIRDWIAAGAPAK